MTGHRQRLFSLLFLAGFAGLSIACVEPPVEPPIDEPDDGKSGIVLTRIGHAALEVHPGEVHTLRALLQQVQVGPVPNGNVVWEIKGASKGGATLSTNASITDENGLAATELHVGDTARFAIIANSEGAEGTASWQVDVRPVEKRVSITSTGPEFELVEPHVANVTVAKERNLRIRVRVSYADNRAVVNEAVTFRVLSDPPPEGVLVETAELGGVAFTDGAGEAVAFVQTGLTTQGFDLTATLESGSFAQFTFTVLDSDGTCRNNAQCLPGQVCRNRVCTDRGDVVGRDCSVEGDAACPFGFVCNEASKKCVSAAGSCATGCPNDYICDAQSDACVPPDDCELCPDGFDCIDDVPICKPVDPENVMDLTGLWFTRHTFDINEGLPGWVQGLAKYTRQIHQLMNGQVSGNIPSWVSSIIQSLFQQFVPPWVQTLIALMDSALTIFSELRADGEMVLSPIVDNATLEGEEIWSSFIFYFLPQCGGNIGGDPNKPPPCARVDIYTDDIEVGSAAVEVFPFTVRVGSGNPATAVIGTRQVNLALAGILKYALDQVVYYTTGYPSLEGPPGRPQEGALYNLVDCPGIASGVQGYEIIVETICSVAVQAVAHVIADELQNTAVKTDALRFSGQATARGASAHSNYATEIGYEDFEFRANPDGAWDGEFMGLVDGVPGRWRAARVPFF